MSLLLPLLLAAPAWAFCGAYVGELGQAPSNNQSRIVVSRSDRETVLTMFNDAQGDATSFGILVPVPEVIHEGDVRRLDRALLDHADAVSAPRAVTYDCGDLYPVGVDPESSTASAKGGDTAEVPADTGSPGGGNPTPDAGPKGTGGGGGGCFGGSAWADDTGGSRYLDTADDGVDVEEQFDLGEYSVWVLSAQEAGALQAWLDSNGFSVPERTAGVLQEYLDRGDHFLALRVDLERAPADGFLSPLQFRYHADDWSLPIRLGATSSSGVQDLLLYVLTPPGSGAAGISNYAEVAAPVDECLVDADALDTWYDTQLDAAMDLPLDPTQLGGRTGLAWVTEYSWTGGSCDPCPADGPLSQAEAAALAPFAHVGYHFTRLHLRYTPDAVPQDLALYSSGIEEPVQVRYIRHEWELESDFPRCDGSVPDHPGSCFTADWWARHAEGTVTESVPLRETRTGCAASAALLVLPLLLAPWRRRA